MKTVLAVISLSLCAALASAPVAAQYPTKAIRLVSPVTAGSGADTLARIVGQALGKSLLQPVLVENKPGADGVVAARSVVAAPADGYTLLFGGSGIAALALTASPAPFDAIADFAPVSTVGRTTYGLFVHPDLPRSMADFISYARSRPGTVNYASVNLTMDFAASQLMKATGIEMMKVPYKGGAQAITDLIAGRVQVFFGPLANGLPYAKEGRLRFLATHPQRTAAAPEIPSLAEGGASLAFHPGYYIVFAPAKTPREVIEKLSHAVNAVLQEDGVRSQLEQQALSVEGSTPQRATALIQESVRVWTDFVRENKLTGR